MGVLNKFKDLVGLDEDDYEEEDMTEEDFDTSAEQMERKKIDPKTSIPQRRGPEPRMNEVPDYQSVKSGNAFRLIITDPSGFDDCPKLVDSLKQRRPVILNLEKIDPESARKVFDFLSGATYALNGSIQKIAENIFVFAPENVDIAANDSFGGYKLGDDIDRWG